MAKDTAPLLMQQRRFAFKIETTTGTYETLAAANAVTRVYNPSFTQAIEQVERENNASLSNRKREFGARAASVSFTTLVHGSGATLPYWSNLLLACGMEATDGVFTPKTGATDTLSLGGFMTGRSKYVIGAMGNGVLTSRRGQAAQIDWTFNGKWKLPDSTNVTGITYDSTISPRGATITLDGQTYRMPEVVFDFGNNVILREDDNELTTGYRAAYITARAPRVRFSPEALPLATKNWFLDHINSETFPMTMTIGTTAGNQIIVDFPQLQLIDPPNEEDRDGMMADALEFMPVQDTDDGDDEYSIEITTEAP